ncbi:MAG: DUF1634 domain-containing protein [Deltaproteobacteria bacterium]|nr:DUF1634 domain-containing protein [Deltaproteobacteria bacterium]
MNSNTPTNTPSATPSPSGVVYGDIAFWMAVAGSMVAIVGMFLYFTGNQFFDSESLLNGICRGQRADQIWLNASPAKNVLSGHWYLHHLGTSDGISMLGIGIACLAGVFGAWGSFVTMAIKKDNPPVFVIFVFVIALILSASALGWVSIH